MGWLFESVTDIFGHQLGRDRPWWVEWLAWFGCLLLLGLLALPFLLLLGLLALPFLLLLR